MPSDTVEKIILSAEKQARSGGYNGFSFREIAKEIGIKSVSIHYHFPTKADLATELTRRYTERFENKLNAIASANKTLHRKLLAYAIEFYEAAKSENEMCLCGLFTAEIDILPDAVTDKLQQFFKLNEQWLIVQLIQHDTPLQGEQTPQKVALQLIATMEGAILLAKDFKSQNYFHDAVDLSAFSSL
jgi:TetR/AcrR family transcriptional repressor of nem operon